MAIIRLSGPESVSIAKAVFSRSRTQPSWTPKTHRIYHGHVLDIDGSIVDEVQLLYFCEVSMQPITMHLDLDSGFRV